MVVHFAKWYLLVYSRQAQTSAGYYPIDFVSDVSQLLELVKGPLGQVPKLRPARPIPINYGILQKLLSVSEHAVSWDLSRLRLVKVNTTEESIQLELAFFEQLKTNFFLYNLRLRAFL